VKRRHAVHFAQHAFDVNAQDVARVKQIFARRFLPQPGDVDRDQVVLGSGQELRRQAMSGNTADGRQNRLATRADRQQQKDAAHEQPPARRPVFLAVIDDKLHRFTQVLVFGTHGSAH